MSRLSLPPPSVEEAAHSQRLTELIRAEIRAQGSISFARFMELALYAAGLGYYSAGLPKFGKQGDFITAPELGSLFAQSLSHANLPTLSKLSNSSVLELGPGSGALAAEILLELAQHNALPEHYWLLERSADLRARQRETLSDRCPHLLERVEWLDAPPDSTWQGVLLANEVIDALPVARFTLKKEGIFLEHVILAHHHELALCEVPAESHPLQDIENILKNLPLSLPRPYSSEYIPDLSHWFLAVAGKLERGMALFIDYGYLRHEFYSPNRNHGTLRCHYRHRVHSDPLWFPGLQDITASVDFTAVKEAGECCGFTVQGYWSQSEFLIENKILEFFEQSLQSKPTDHIILKNEIKNLLLPTKMGESFRVINFIV